MTKLDQDFISACKRAAELRPDKFTFCNKLIVGKQLFINDRPIELGRATQDSIDAMMAAVGCLVEIWFDELTQKFQYRVWKKTNLGGYVLYLCQPDNSPDKLPAAKAAWVAVVGEMEKEKK